MPATAPAFGMDRRLGAALQLRSAVSVSMAAHAVAVALAVGLSMRRGAPVVPEPMVRVSLNLGPIRNPASPARVERSAEGAESKRAPPVPSPAPARAPRQTQAPAADPLPSPTARVERSAEGAESKRAPSAASPHPLASRHPLASPHPLPSPTARVERSAEGAESKRAPSESALDLALKRVASEAPGESSARFEDVGVTAPSALAATPSGSAEDLVLAYAALIRAAVESACQIPSGIPRDQAGDAVVQLRIDSSGRVLSFTLARSSGYAVLDDVLRSVFARITLPAPPAAIAARAQRGGLRIAFPFASVPGSSR